MIKTHPHPSAANSQNLPVLRLLTSKLQQWRPRQILLTFYYNHVIMYVWATKCWRKLFTRSRSSSSPARSKVLFLMICRTTISGTIIRAAAVSMSTIIARAVQKKSPIMTQIVLPSTISCAILPIQPVTQSTRKNSIRCRKDWPHHQWSKKWFWANEHAKNDSSFFNDLWKKKKCGRRTGSYTRKNIVTKAQNAHRTATRWIGAAHTHSNVPILLP